jgi:ATP-dependent DNA helicase RecQ
MQTTFNLQLVAKKSNHNEAQVHAVLHKLKEKNIVEYQSKNNDTTLVFNEIREDERTINRVSKHLKHQNQLKKTQLESVIEYINNKDTCKSQLILNYFGEKNTEDCGHCSYCITHKIKKKDSKNLAQEIVTLLKQGDLSSRDIQSKTNSTTDDIFAVLQDLLENNIILVQPNNTYTLRL